MERKLVRQGRNALTVTLPAKWLKSKGLGAGKTVHISEGNDLVVSALGAARRSIAIDAREHDKSGIFNLAIAAYIEGYDLLTVRHNNPRAAHDLSQWLIGMVIEENTATKMVLRSIIVVPEDNFDALLRRSMHMLVQQARILVDIAAGKQTEENMKQQERLLDASVLYCLRYLSKYQFSGSHRQFMLCSTIELAADQLSQLAKHIGKQRSLAQLILKHVEEYAAGLFAHDVKKLTNSLRSFRNSVGNRTFAEGIAASLIEILHNYVGYLAGELTQTPGE
jgi:phosphate uptake regulator